MSPARRREAVRIFFALFKEESMVKTLLDLLGGFRTYGDYWVVGVSVRDGPATVASVVSAAVAAITAMREEAAAIRWGAPERGPPARCNDAGAD
ncbi:MAG TPA: hypothetical protein VND64_03965 [Pirellulales bacterium]|nr:hypothetical protein [Pirellulales bacterium]